MRQATLDAEVAGTSGPTGGGPARPGLAARRAVLLLVRAVERLVRLSVDELDEPGLEAELSGIETAMRRLEARRCKTADALASRRARRAEQAARTAGRDEIRERERARRDTQRDLADRHRWSPGEAKRRLEMGRRMRGAGPAQHAFDAGRLPVRHAELLADTLRWLDGDARARAQRLLLEAAEHEDAVTFGRTCRRLLAELGPSAASQCEDRRHGRRRASMAATDDGMLALSGQWAGIDGEIVATAVDAFRMPDAPGERRTAEQRTADAIVEMARAALRGDEAPAQHGARPHVVVTVPYQAILEGAGVVESRWLGPLPFSEIRQLLADAAVSRLLVDPDGAPVEAGEEVRTVPAGLWRSLLVRDGGCIAEGCDVPAGWCDTMHLGTPYRLQGRLGLDTAALGCRHHHRCYDQRGWTIHWTDDRRPVLRPPP